MILQDFKTKYPKLKFLVTTSAVRNVASDNHMVDHISGCKWNSALTPFTLNADGSFGVPSTNLLSYVSGQPPSFTGGKTIFCAYALTNEGKGKRFLAFDVGDARANGPGVTVGSTSGGGYVTINASNWLNLDGLNPSTGGVGNGPVATCYFVNTTTRTGRVVRASFGTGIEQSSVQDVTVTPTGPDSTLPFTCSTLLTLPTGSSGTYTSLAWAAIAELDSNPIDQAMIDLVRAAVANGAKSIVNSPNELALIAA